MMNFTGATVAAQITVSHASSRALHRLHAFALDSDWSIVLFTSVVIGQSKLLWF